MAGRVLPGFYRAWRRGTKERSTVAWAAGALIVLGAPGALFTHSALGAPSRTLDCAAGMNCGTLTVVAQGYPPAPIGSGEIVSDPAGIDCKVALGVTSGTCTSPFSWATSQGSALNVKLTATPAQGTLVCNAGCAGGPSTAPFSVNYGLGNGMNGVEYFSLIAAKETLTVSTRGDGTGTVTSTPAGITCGSTCSGSFYTGNVTLTATPDAGAAFSGWTGACATQTETCIVSLNAATTTAAVFGLATTTTTTASTTTVTVPSTPAKPKAKPPLGLNVQLIALKATRSALHARIENVELNVGRRVTIALTLTRGGNRLAQKVLGVGRQSDVVLTLVVPGSVAPGGATLTIAIRDAAGDHRTISRTISIRSRS